MVMLSRFLLLCLPVMGTAGSFYLSASGEIPCPYCLVVRYSLIAIFVISVAGVLSKKDLLFLLTAIISIAPVVASSILVVNDYFLQGGTEICYTANEEVHCTSPLVLGIHVSLYALLISSIIFFISLFIGLSPFILKNEGNSSR